MHRDTIVDRSAASSDPSALYIAYHYPPILISSGSHRSLAFTRHLAATGWSVRVLTASLKAYERWSKDQLAFIPEGVEVIRGYARDVSRHYSWRGKFWSAMALPDNWQSWIAGGVAAGLWSIARHRPDVIVSTYPIASAHVIGYALHRLTGVPWVADLRDPMAQPDYPSDPRRKAWFEWIEKKIVRHCAFATVTAPGAQRFYEDKFPDGRPDFWRLVPNGFDEELYPGEGPDDQTGLGSGPRILLHSGIIYPSERDPGELFLALAELKATGRIDASALQIRLRATGHDAVFAAQIERLGIGDIVRLEPTIPYREALSEMLGVDGLLLLQAANCNDQIPAKAYEYLRARKPVLALTPAEGDTGRLLAASGAALLAPLDGREQIKQALLDFLARLERGSFTPPDEQTLRVYSRQHQAAVFERMLNELVGGRRGTD